MPLQKRVSDLPAVPQVAATDLLIVSSSNATKRCTVQQIGAFFSANGVAGPQGPQGPQGLSGIGNWEAISDKPSTFPPSSHTHALSEVVGLQSALDGKQASGSYATLVGGKVPESQLPPIVTTWEGLTGKPSTFPPSTHSHVISDVTGLQSALDGKQASGSYAATVHSHAIADVTGLQSALDAKATPSDVTSAVAAVVGAAPASLNTLQELAAALSDDASFATTVTNALAGKAATVHTHVISSVTGLQSALDGKAVSSHTHTASAITDFTTAAAAAAPVQSVNGQTGAVTISTYTLPVATSSTLGGVKQGSNVTIDGTGVISVAAPFSGAYADLTGKPTLFSGSYADLTNVPSTFAPSTHSHAISDVSGLQTALDGKQASGSYAAASHTHGISDVTGLQTALDGKAASTHAHAIADVTGLQTALDGKQASGSYAAATHGHAIGDVTGLQTALDGKAALSHAHPAIDISGLATVATSGSYNDLTNKPTIPSAYTLPTASASTLGGVRIGSGISIDGSGIISASAGVSDGNKGDVTVSGSGATWTINAGAVIEADLANAVRNQIFHPFLLGGM